MAKLWMFLIFLGLLVLHTECAGSQRDDDFAEFDEEEFVNEPVEIEPAKEAGRTESQSPPEKEQASYDKRAEQEKVNEHLSSIDAEEEMEAEIENEADGFVESEQYDPNEFEGFDDDGGPSGRRAGSSSQPQKPPELKIAEVPMVLGRNWEHYYMEYLLICGLLFYLIWYASGKSTNSKLANAWLETHLELLNTHFSLVGDEGTSKDVNVSNDQQNESENPHKVKFIKEAEHIYTLWCTGRQHIEGMLVTLKLKKRQDLFTSLWRIFRPSHDQICIRFYMDKDEMDTFVLCAAKKSAIPKLQKDLMELSSFCPERKSGDRFNLPSSFTVMAEIGESVSGLLDPKIIKVIEHYESEVEYLFFSDQYNPKPDDTQQQNQQIKRPDPMKILQFCFNLPSNLSNPVEVMERMQPLLLASLYLADKVHRYRLQREAKAKADKNRQKIQEEYLKSTHAQRQEAAQLRREEKRRMEKEKILSEDDPEKQRKWEERDYRREMKKRGPKVKAVKVKAM